MPEDLEDKITDFEMMLEGFVMTDETHEKDTKMRILCYWYSMSAEILKKLNVK